MPLHVCVCTCSRILVGHSGSGKKHSQQLVGLMPGEIMNLTNWILGNGGDSSCGKKMRSLSCI